MMRTYTHIELDQEVQSIGGHYSLDKEVRMPYNGREILYIVGLGIIDTSCCGMGGCRYAIVPGYVINWKARTNQHGLAVSDVEPIRDEGTRREISAHIKKTELVQVVDFH
ncbi:MAG: hypothetical protein C4532_07210 [Candidatus Abyssobacteria bacterium SURF_17]|uniref:Uncharacterized protein n=1 Tax=Candidatus Abyssobacteria bacterium SURF_17 TaxID=2093361 RepID=A0A419F1I0_9BACT|nr:MAG: hypothetical protein C4532_07210 [Candidatus Abyssubacteria bacterium SURF_17]